MSWLRIDDGLPENPKVAHLSDRAFRTYINALCYSSRALSDGRLPPTQMVGISLGSRKAVAELVDAGLLHLNGKGYEVHDYLEYNPTAEEIKQKRKEAAERMRYRSRGEDGQFE
jgi:hypothetical protein